jgi:hypothetical protein
LDQEDDQHSEGLDSQRIENPFTETYDNVFAEEFQVSKAAALQEVVRSDSSSLKRRDDNYDNMAK